MPRRLSFSPTSATGWRLLVAAVMLLAAGLRLWHLDNRPAHFDEGVNGMFTDRMVASGFYAYDPTNYHGPLHFYVLFLFKRLLGRNLWALRLSVALVSIVTVWLVFRFQRFFPRRVCLLAALGLALSPASVYFGRDAIHEGWLAFFLVLTLLGGLGLWRDGGAGDLWALGLGLAGMILTKETYVIHVAAFVLALGTLAVWEQLADILPRLVPPSLARWLPRPSGFPPPAPARWTAADLAAVSAVGLGSIVFFYSGTFFNPAGLRGLYETFAPWFQKSGLHRGNGEGHVKPFYYWLELLAGQEPWAFLGMLAAVALLWVRTGWGVRYVSIYALGTLLAYCLIPYKTPWCMVAIVWPFFIPAGAALAALWQRGNVGRVAGGVLLAAVGGFTLWRTTDLSFGHPAEAREEHFLRVNAPPGSLAARMLPRLPFFRPGATRETYEWDVPSYVYVQTFDVVSELTLPLLELTRESPANFALRGLILADHYHPLPWLLGDFYRVGYYGSTNPPPPDLGADFLVVAAERDPEVEAGLREPYFRENIQLRPAMKPLTIYLRASVFQHLMGDREPEFMPGRTEAESAPAPTP